MEHLKSCLEAAGSALDRIVKCNVYCSNASYFAEINKVYAEYITTHRPARIFICTAGWFGPFDMEIDCVALAA
jgi:2-iminobutanoate/2-iminopropanoate deaminase